MRRICSRSRETSEGPNSYEFSYGRTQRRAQIMDHATVIAGTRRWIASMVIGLDLCPFARRVFEGEKIRYVVSDARDEAGLLADLAAAADELAGVPIGEVETTLLVHPLVLDKFADFNDFLDAAESALDERGLSGVLQIATFHPDYHFAGVDPLAAENATNRSPYPMLHLLREASISAVAGDKAEMREIPRRNVATLRRLGRGRLIEMLNECRKG